MADGVVRPETRVREGGGGGRRGVREKWGEGGCVGSGKEVVLSA